MNLQDLNDLKAKALSEAQTASDAAAVEAVRIEYLARKGLLPKVMQELKNVSPEEKPMFGKTVNELKNELTEMLRELHLPTVRAEFEEMARQAENQSLSFEQYLVELIRRECEERRVAADGLLPDSLRS